MYLKIQNPGVAPLEGYTVLGVSTTRNSGNGTIGQFGSGSKHSVGLLLRQGIKPIVFLGKLRLDFDTEDRSVNDGLVERGYKQVRVKLSGQYEGKSVNRSIDLGFSLDYGSYDWNDIAMACREFVSNAIDRTIREENGFRDAYLDSRLEVCYAPDESVRAKDGFTRVFIPLTPEINQFYSELPWRFLHFSDPDLISQRLLPKKMRGINPNSGKNEVDTAVIYKNGVFVRRVQSYFPSIFDYNFGAELELDECRNVNDSTVASVAGFVLKNSNSDEIKHLLQAGLDGRKVWESENIGSYTLSTSYSYESESEKEKIKKNWQEAYNKVAADAVACDVNNGAVTDYVRKKGHRTAVFHNGAVLTVLKSYGVKTAENVLSGLEKDGIDPAPPTPSVIQGAEIIWKKIEELGMLNGMNFPLLKCFHQSMNAGVLLRGRYENSTVYINTDIADGGLTTDLMTTILEEITHHITQSTDLSRDFQDYAFSLCAKMIMGK